MGRVNQMPIFRDVLEEANNHYGKLLTGLTGPTKTAKNGQNRASDARRDPSRDAQERCAWAEAVWLTRRQTRDQVVLLWRLRLGGRLGHAGQRQRRRVFAGGIGGGGREDSWGGRLAAPPPPPAPPPTPPQNLVRP